jgi:hypothetical protein
MTKREGGGGEETLQHIAKQRTDYSYHNNGGQWDIDSSWQVTEMFAAWYRYVGAVLRNRPQQILSRQTLYSKQ